MNYSSLWKGRKQMTNKIQRMRNYQDEIVRLLNEGHSKKEVFEEIEKNYFFKSWNKQARQELANEISEVDQINVYASSKISN